MTKPRYEMGIKSVIGSAVRTGDRSIEGHCSVYGNLDRFSEVVTDGAWGAEGDTWALPAVAFHKIEDPIGGAKSLVDTTGMFSPIEIAKTKRGDEILELHDVGALPGLSVGYFIKKSRHGRIGTKSVRFLTELEPFEVTVCTVPVNERSRTLSRKSFGEDLVDEAGVPWFLSMDGVGRKAGGWVDLSEEVGTKAGKRNSQRDQDAIQAVHDHATSLGAMCEEPDEVDDAGSKGVSDDEAPNPDEQDALTDYERSLLELGEKSVPSVCEAKDDCRNVALRGLTTCKIHTQYRAQTGEKALVSLDGSWDDIRRDLEIMLEAKHRDDCRYLYVNTVMPGSTTTSGTVLFTMRTGDWDAPSDTASKTYVTGWSKTEEEYTLSETETEVELVTAMQPKGPDNTGESDDADAQHAIAEQEMELLALEVEVVA